MKIKDIQLKGYGKFIHENVNLNFSKGLNVIYGKNEAGKSTIRHALSELLYGFQAKKVDKHPYYTGDTIHISGNYHDQSNETVRIERSFDTEAKGKKIMGPHLLEVGNTALSDIGQVPFYLYRGLFEMDLSDLVKLDGRKWTEVEEQIALQYGLDNMLTPQQVLSDLENEMHELWRPHNRGKFKVKSIDEKLFRLREDKRDHIIKRKSFEEKVKKKQSIEDEIKKLSDDIDKKTLWLQQSEAQLDAFRKLSEVREIEMKLASNNIEAIDLEDYHYLVRENESLRNEKSEIEKEIGHLQKNKVQLTDLEKMAVNDHEISSLYHAYHSAYEAYSQQKDALKHAKTQIEQRSLELTSDPWNEALLNYWRVLNVTGLHKAVRNRLNVSFRSTSLWTLFLIGVAVALGGHYYEVNYARMGGGALSLLTLILMASSIGKKVFEYGDIQFNKGVWKSKDVFIDACEKMKQVSEGYHQQTVQVQALRDKYKKNQQKLEETMMRYGYEKGQDLEEKALEVLHCQNKSRDKEKEFDLYQSKLSDLNSRKRKVSHSLMMNQRKLNVYRNELEKLGGSVEEALEKLDTLIALDHRRKTLIEQLETFEISNPGLVMYKKFVDFDMRIETERNGIGAMKEKREDLRIELMALHKDEERIFEDQRLDAVEAEIEKLQEQRRATIDQYNQLKMTHTLIAFADKTFRKKFQPDLLTEASKLLDLFTDGRYNDIATGENGNIQVNDTKKGRFIPVHDYLSRGTLEQVYMALRLAVAQTIDKTEQKLPIILDEVFVNWDHERLNSALKALLVMSEERQIIYMTCHDWMAEKLSLEYGANQVTLS
ncbi:ATP-binding protein [Fusibacter sp. JL216-2]|uniref:ATP-binding protein n=1 Tax=Fusibacter sp. JL216-2 TaxID=3071453 RepID=UPI003D32490A